MPQHQQIVDKPYQLIVNKPYQLIVNKPYQSIAATAVLPRKRAALCP